MIAVLDFERWDTRTRPVALGLGRLHPWEYERYTVAEIEMRLSGVIGDRWARLAWQTCHLMNATGNFPKDSPITPARLLEGLTLDPRWIEDENERATVPPETAAALSEAQAEGAAQMGIGTMGTLSPEELERAYAEAEVAR